MRPIYFILLPILFFYACKDVNYDAPIIETSYREIIDTSYGSDERHKIDLYLPENRNEDTKLILMIHGGAWTSGNKSELTASAKAIRKLDPSIAIANINYRFVNGKSILIQDQLDDVASVIKFISANQNKFNISNGIAIVGASSGAHLSLMYAYKYDTSNRIKCVGNYFGPTRLDVKEWYDAFNLGLFMPVKDILHPIFGKPWNQELYSSFSPYDVVNASNGKPTISFHGGIDLIVPKDQSKDLHAKLQEMSIPSEYHEYPNSIMHVLSDEDLANSYPKLLQFINQHWQ